MGQGAECSSSSSVGGPNRGGSIQQSPVNHGFKAQDTTCEPRNPSPSPLFRLSPLHPPPPIFRSQAHFLPLPVSPPFKRFITDCPFLQVQKIGEFYYNFWQDGDNPRGLWRRTTPQSFCSNDPQWEVLIDVDALGTTEGVSWVWKGHTLLKEAGGSSRFRFPPVPLLAYPSDPLSHKFVRLSPPVTHRQDPHKDYRVHQPRRRRCHCQARV